LIILIGSSGSRRPVGLIGRSKVKVEVRPVSWLRLPVGLIKSMPLAGSRRSSDRDSDSRRLEQVRASWRSRPVSAGLGCLRALWDLVDVAGCDCRPLLALALAHEVRAGRNSEERPPLPAAANSCGPRRRVGYCVHKHDAGVAMQSARAARGGGPGESSGPKFGARNLRDIFAR